METALEQRFIEKLEAVLAKGAMKGSKAATPTSEEDETGQVGAALG